jgi:chromosome segregation ATPase
MPTIWDPNLSELAQACADAGHRPTDSADLGDVYQCAVAALEEVAEMRDTWVPPDEHSKALDEEREDAKAEGKEEAEEAAEKAQEEADKRIEELEGDLLAAQQDLKAAREVLGATDSSAARLEMWLLEQARAARDSWVLELRELAQRLERLADELDRPRSQKARVANGLRLNAADLKRRADNALATPVCRLADEEGDE